jgi:hypothetical protein
MSCVLLPKRVRTLYGEKDGMPLHQEFHYELDFYMAHKN